MRQFIIILTLVYTVCVLFTVSTVYGLGQSFNVSSSRNAQALWELLRTSDAESKGDIAQSLWEDIFQASGKDDVSHELRGRFMFASVKYANSTDRRRAVLDKLPQWMPLSTKKHLTPHPTPEEELSRAVNRSLQEVYSKIVLDSSWQESARNHPAALQLLLGVCRFELPVNRQLAATRSDGLKLLEPFGASPEDTHRVALAWVNAGAGVPPDAHISRWLREADLAPLRAKLAESKADPATFPHEAARLLTLREDFQTLSILKAKRDEFLAAAGAAHADQRLPLQRMAENLESKVAYLESCFVQERLLRELAKPWAPGLSNAGLANNLLRRGIENGVDKAQLRAAVIACVETTLKQPVPNMDANWPVEKQRSLSEKHRNIMLGNFADLVETARQAGVLQADDLVDVPKPLPSPMP